MNDQNKTQDQLEVTMPLEVAQAVHGDIRHLEKNITILTTLPNVHGDIRHLVIQGLL